MVKAGKTVTAGRTMAYARACFAWGKRRAKVAENPFAELPIAAGATESERVLSDAEIAEVWTGAGMLGYVWPIIQVADPDPTAARRSRRYALDRNRPGLDRMAHTKRKDEGRQTACRAPVRSGAGSAALHPVHRRVRSRVHDHCLPSQCARCNADGQAEARTDAHLRVFAGQALS